MTNMRKLLSLVLLLSMCLGVCACLSSCGAFAGAAKYDKADAVSAVAALRTYIRESKGVGKSVIMLAENEAVQVYTYLQAPKTEEEKAKVDEEPLYVTVLTFSTDKRYSFRLDLILDKVNPENALRRFKFSDRNLGRNLMIVEDTLNLPTYTGAELMSFDKIEYPEPETGSDGQEAESSAPIPDTEYLKEVTRSMLNLMIITMDSYLEKTIKHDREDFGFVSYNEKNNPKNLTPVAALPGDQGVHTLSTAPGLPVAAFLTADGLTDTDTTDETTDETTDDTTESETVAETEEDLGSAFSSARWSYSLRMTLLGMGMVFAVLAILWGILSIFKLVFAGKTPKAPKAPKEAKSSEPAPAPAPVASAVPAGTDPAVVAAITAAIAEMIAADPELSAQYAGGFRVVEFKRKSGKTSWNH